MANPQNRIQLKGSTRPALAGGRDVGPADPNEQIEVTVLLRRGSKPSEFRSIEQMAKRPPNERRYLSREEFARLHGASEADLEKIRAFAMRKRAEGREREPSESNSETRGTVQAFNAAFGAELRRYEHTSGTYRCRTGDSHHSFRFGRSDRRSSWFGQPPASQTAFSIAEGKPKCSRSRYIHLVFTARSSQSLRVPIWCDGCWPVHRGNRVGRRLQRERSGSFFKNLGISTPKVTAVSVDGGTNSPTGDPSGADGEVELDIEVAGAIAPSAQIAAYFAPNTDQGFIDAITICRPRFNAKAHNHLDQLGRS